MDQEQASATATAKSAADSYGMTNKKTSNGNGNDKDTDKRQRQKQRQIFEVFDGCRRPVYYWLVMGAVLSTRDLLLEVGLKQLRSTGYTASGVKEVLDLAKVPKGSFYHYFPSKEEFAVEVFHLYATGEMERATRVFGDRKVAPLKRLRKYFEELISVYGQRGEITGCLVGSLSLEVADHSPRLQTELKAVFEGWQKGVADVLREAVERGDLAKSTRVDALAGFLLNSYEGALVRMKADKSDRPLENFLYFAFDVFLKK